MLESGRYYALWALSEDCWKESWKWCQVMSNTYLIAFSQEQVSFILPLEICAPNILNNKVICVFQIGLATRTWAALKMFGKIHIKFQTSIVVYFVQEKKYGIENNRFTHWGCLKSTLRRSVITSRTSGTSVEIICNRHRELLKSSSNKSGIIMRKLLKSSLGLPGNFRYVWGIHGECLWSSSRCTEIIVQNVWNHFGMSEVSIGNMLDLR